MEKLHQKKAVLVAQRDQLLANLNMTIGAIAMVDELIGEAAADQAAAQAMGDEAASATDGAADAAVAEPQG